MIRTLHNKGLGEEGGKEEEKEEDWRCRQGSREQLRTAETMLAARFLPLPTCPPFTTKRAFVTVELMLLEETRSLKMNSY